MVETSSEERRKEIEAWWALIARILSFFLGAVVFGYEYFIGDKDLAVMAIGGGFMTPVAADIIATARGSK